MKFFPEDNDRERWLAEDSKEYLVDEILRLSRENRELQEANKRILEELEKFKAKEQLRKANIEIKAKRPKKRWKKLGAPVGHPGTTRPRPEIIDHIVEQILENCPDCGHPDLKPCASKTQSHVQEDIVLAKVEATEFIRRGYWCPHCQTIKVAPYAPEEIPNSYLGPNILIQTVIMKYHQGLSFEKIRQFFKDFCNLTVTDSALAQALQRISGWLKVEEDVIAQAIRGSPHIHIDETGWKVAGTNHWLWNFVNARLALYRIRRSRGRAVPQEIMSDNYQGIVLSDFLSAYDHCGRLRQRCLVHLKRDMKHVQLIDQSLESQRAYKKLNRILNDAYRLNSLRGTLDALSFVRRLHRLNARLLDFAVHPYQAKHWQRLSKRLLKYHDEILTFLKVPQLAHDNNLVERMIRPNVIMRKISFQNMSTKGARAHEVLMSLLQTLRLRNQNPFEFFKQTYLTHRKGNPIPLLV